LKAAVYNGLLSSAVVSLPDPLFFCPSGNCTWDPFTTLALGVHCADAPELYDLDCSVDDVGLERCVMIGTKSPSMNTGFSAGNGTDTDLRNVFYFVEGTFMEPYIETHPYPWPANVGWSTNIDWLRATGLQKSRLFAPIYRNNTRGVVYEGMPDFPSCEDNEEYDD
jgi:hypothetical protein